MNVIWIGGKRTSPEPLDAKQRSEPNTTCHRTQNYKVYSKEPYFCHPHHRGPPLSQTVGGSSATNLPQPPSSETDQHQEAQVNNTLQDMASQLLVNTFSGDSTQIQVWVQRFKVYFDAQSVNVLSQRMTLTSLRMTIILFNNCDICWNPHRHILFSHVKRTFHPFSSIQQSRWSKVLLRVYIYRF